MIVRGPGGRRFDTQKKIYVDEPLEDTPLQGNTNSSSSPSIYTTAIPSYRESSGSGNIWSRINDFVAGIGDWFDDHAESYSTNISTIFYFLAWIGLGISVIGQLIMSQFLAAIITGIIGSLVVYFAAGIGMVILMYLISFVFKIFRFIFYNIYTLLITIAIVSLFIISHQTSVPKDRTSIVSNTVSLQPNYICNATSLNVRSAANTNAGVIGKLTKGQDVYVYSIDRTTKFAQIDYNGRVAYASADYLVPKDAASIPVGNTESTQLAKPVGMTGWSTFQLNGQVQKVIYDDGRYIYFNTDGNVLSHNVRESVRGVKEFGYEYSSPTRFVVKGDESHTPYKIVFDNNTRQEIWDNSEALGLTFTYDEKGRLTTVSEPEYGIGQTETYAYEADNTYPANEEKVYYSDDGTNIKESFVFSNYSFDSQGNWISRSVSYKKVDESEDNKEEPTTKDYTEKRTITYYQ